MSIADTINIINKTCLIEVTIQLKQTSSTSGLRGTGGYWGVLARVTGRGKRSRRRGHETLMATGSAGHTAWWYMTNAIPQWTTYWSVSSLTISCWPHMESIGSTIPLCLDCVWKLPGTQAPVSCSPRELRGRAAGSLGRSRLDYRSILLLDALIQLRCSRSFWNSEL